MYYKIKHRIFRIIQPSTKGSRACRIFNLLIIILILINAAMVIADTFELTGTVKAVVDWFEVFSVIIFTIEYILRLWTATFLYPKLSGARARVKYIFSFIALIDLFAILPFYIPFIIPVDLRVLRMLRIIRLLRIFKVGRYKNALTTIWSVFVRKKSQLISSVFVVGLLMVVASVLMYDVENEAQPDAFSNAFDALWWAVATLTTVGYGDVFPITVAGKLLSSVVAMLGIALVAVPTGIISAGFMEIVGENDKDETDEKQYCPYCGHKLRK